MLPSLIPHVSPGGMSSALPGEERRSPDPEPLVAGATLLSRPVYCREVGDLLS